MKHGAAVLAFAGLLALLAAAPSSSVDVATAAACAPSLPHAAGTTVETIATADGTREYRLHIPPSYTGDDRVPLVLGFHGLGSNDLEQEIYSAFSTRADAGDGGFIVVYPQGLSAPPPLSFTYFNAWQLASPGANDVAFVGTLLDALESSLCIDPARVFSTGMSNGAMMSVRLACSLSDRIAAVAPVAGAYEPPMSLGLNAAETCGATRPVPLLAFHGTADDTVPFLGGDGGAGGVPITFRLPIDTTTPDDDALQGWAARNGCTSGRQEATMTSEVRFVSYEGCDEGAEAQLYIVEGGGHTWPGAIDVPSLGHTTHDIIATDLIWQFFQDHPLVVATQGDYDGDTITDVLDPDDDNDGCRDTAELPITNGSQVVGGLRSARDFWDFYDVWTHPTSNPTGWVRNGTVDLFSDIFGVAKRYGTHGTVPATEQQRVAAALTPPPDNTGYHMDYDRSAPAPGADLWDMGPPNGTIDLFTDILGVALQFGHHCA